VLQWGRGIAAWLILLIAAQFSQLAFCGIPKAADSLLTCKNNVAGDAVEERGDASHAAE